MDRFHLKPIRIGYLPLWIALALFTLVPQLGLGSNRCSDLFQNETIQTRALSTEELFEQMNSRGKSLGFKLKKINSAPNERLLYRIINGETVKIGRLFLLDVDLLFEWKSAEHHQRWITNGKIDRLEMNEIIKITNPFYQVGKGYYVSTNPNDSISYGTHLTVFENSVPLVLLTPDKAKYTQTEEQLHAYRDLGISGAMNHDTWLSVYNEIHLSKAVTMNAAHYAKIRKSKNQLYTNFLYAESVMKANVFSPDLIKKVSATMAANQKPSPRDIEMLSAEIVLSSTDFLKELKESPYGAEIFKLIILDLVDVEVYVVINKIEKSLNPADAVDLADYLNELKTLVPQY